MTTSKRGHEDAVRLDQFVKRDPRSNVSNWITREAIYVLKCVVAFFFFLEFFF